MPPSELTASALTLAPVSGANHPPVSIDGNLPWISGSLPRAALTAMPLALADFAAMAVSFTVAWSLTTWLFPQAEIEWSALGIALFSALFVAGAAVGIYPGVGLSAIGEVRLAATTAACMGPVFLGVSFLQPSRNLALTFAIAATCLLLIPCLAWFRQALRQSFCRFRWWGQPAIVVGSPLGAQQVCAHLKRNPGYRIAASGHRRPWPRYGIGGSNRRSIGSAEPTHDARSPVQSSLAGGRYSARPSGCPAPSESQGIRRYSSFAPRRTVQRMATR